jgi:hypothetical protein
MEPLYAFPRGAWERGHPGNRATLTTLRKTAAISRPFFGRLVEKGIKTVQYRATQVTACVRSQGLEKTANFLIIILNLAVK